MVWYLSLAFRVLLASVEEDERYDELKYDLDLLKDLLLPVVVVCKWRLCVWNKLSRVKLRGVDMCHYQEQVKQHQAGNLIALFAEQ